MSISILEQAKAIRAAMDTAGSIITNEQAATMPFLYTKWKAKDSEGNAIHYNVGDRRRYGENNIVYECRSEHDAEENNTPDLIPALWKKLDVTHAGTIEDPIPYETGMEIFNGKYYIENEILYLCNRDSVNPLYNNMSDLVGLYVETV